jgi:hypothetical protein
MTGYTAHIDTFARDNLPPRAQWPEFRFDLPELQYPERLNAAAELLDRWVERGEGDRRCFVAPGRRGATGRSISGSTASPMCWCATSAFSRATAC